MTRQERFLAQPMLGDTQDRSAGPDRNVFARRLGGGSGDILEFKSYSTHAPDESSYCLQIIVGGTDL